MKKSSLVFLSLSMIIASAVLSMNVANYSAIPSAYGQTNAAMFATLVASNNSNGNAIMNNAIASSAITNSSSTTTTPTATSNTTEGLQIKKGINYFDSASGYLVYPSIANNNNNNATANTANSSKKLPAVIMIHENRGLNDNIKSMANTLAREGYAVLAVDLFKGQVAQTSQQAQQLAGSARSNSALTISNLQAAVKYVSSLPFVDSSKIASIGWCFGGGQSLQLALHSEQHPLVATILYYGTPLVTDKQELSKIKWPVLGIFGDKDQAIPLSNIQQFKTALDSISIPNEIHI
ncbi:MAG: dienelactone hydrolase family protein, partial [Nitrososphaeraceae archaeon]